MFCKYCGAELKGFSKICPECGSDNNENKREKQDDFSNEKVIMKKKKVKKDKKENNNIYQIFFDEIIFHFFDFRGKTKRKEFFSSILAYFILLFVTLIIIESVFTEGTIGYDEAYDVLGFIVLISAIPYFALLVRRIRDTGLTGWLSLLSFFPPIGTIAIFIIILLPSKNDDSKNSNIKEINNEDDVIVEPNAKTKIITDVDIDPSKIKVRKENGITITVIDNSEEKNN